LGHGQFKISHLFSEKRVNTLNGDWHFTKLPEPVTMSNWWDYHPLTIDDEDKERLDNAWLYGARRNFPPFENRSRRYGRKAPTGILTV